MISTVHLHLHLYLFLFLQIILLSPLISQTLAAVPSDDLVRRSCAHASYPEICLRTVSSAGAAARTPSELAQLAVRISLGCVRKASGFLSGIKAKGPGEQGALRDCLEQMGDSVEELRNSLSALEQLRRGDADFQREMSNAETWVSAALANEDTCLDGFKEIEGRVRTDVRRRMTNVGRVTSNALYLINLVQAQESPAPPSDRTWVSLNL